MTPKGSVEFFEAQFQYQAQAGDLALNPFEAAALPWLSGHLLDWGCGMGNLACAAAARGCTVVALDASPTAIEHLRRRAATEGLAVHATCADLRERPIDGEFDAAVSIGLLAFFDCDTAERTLAALMSHVRPGGLVAINLLTAGTTYVDMFGDQPYCLFEPGALEAHFQGWSMLHCERQSFDAPGGTRKSFETVIARRPDIEAGA